MAIDGLMVIGFGGPTPGCCERLEDCPYGEEARCFVEGILGDNPARRARVDEIVAHYRHLGGFSPYNDLTARQVAALEAELRGRGCELPIACGFRHWRPWAKDAAVELAARGARELLLLILAPHQSSVSWDWYIKFAGEACVACPEPRPRLAAVVGPWWNHLGFVEAQADRIRAAIDGWEPTRRDSAALVFTAHSIPRAVLDDSPYHDQFAETARLCAAAAGFDRHRLAYQSQGRGTIPWAGPAVDEVVDELAAEGVEDVIFAACGFLVDHVEVRYDLDVEAVERCRRAGITPTRAECVHDHPAFIACLADRVVEGMRG